MLRKVGNKIYLGVFNFKFIAWLDKFIYETVFNEEQNSLVINPFLCPYEDVFEMFYLKIDSTGEAYLTLNIVKMEKEDNDEMKNPKKQFAKYDISAEMLKSLLKLNLDMMKSFTILDSNESNLDEDDLEDMVLFNSRKRSMKKSIKMLSALLNVWDGTASEEEKSLVGQPFSPFELAQFGFNDAWERYAGFFNYGDEDYSTNVKEIRSIFKRTLK